MTQTKFTTLPKENWDNEATIEEKNQCPAADWNQVANEIIDVVEKSGEDADTNLQMAQAIVRNALCGDFFTDASTVANIVVLNVNGTYSKPTEYIDGMKVSFIPLYSNTGPATINVNNLGPKSIYLDANSTALSGSEIAVDKLTELRYNATIDGFILDMRELSRATSTSYGTSIFDINFIYGLVPSSSSGVPDEDIDITSGKALCKDGSTIISFDSLTDQNMPTLLGSALANSTTYHLFGFMKDDNTSQLWLDTSLTPTITDIKSANAYRRIFSFKTESDGDIIKFYGTSRGRSIKIDYYNYILEYSDSPSLNPAIPTNITLSIPSGTVNEVLIQGKGYSSEGEENIFIKNSILNWRILTTPSSRGRPTNDVIYSMYKTSIVNMYRDGGGSSNLLLNTIGFIDNREI